MFNVTGYPASLHDARVLRPNEIFDAAKSENILMEPTMDLNGTVIRPRIVGDSAYPLTENMATSQESQESCPSMPLERRREDGEY